MARRGDASAALSCRQEVGLTLMIAYVCNQEDTIAGFLLFGAQPGRILKCSQGVFFSLFTGGDVGTGSAGWPNKIGIDLCKSLWGDRLKEPHQDVFSVQVIRCKRSWILASFERRMLLSIGASRTIRVRVWCSRTNDAVQQDLTLHLYVSPSCDNGGGRGGFFRARPARAARM